MPQFRPADSEESVERPRREIYLPYTFLENGAGINSALFRDARVILRGTEERAKPNSERLREYTDAAIPRIEQQLFAILNVDVVRSGNQLTYNGHPVDIIEKCNGLRMVFGLILVSYAFSFSLPLRNWVRLLILLLSPAAAILCNIIRILPTVWVYGRFSPHVAEEFHLYSGWLMLIVALVMLLGILRVLKWAMIPVMRFTLAG